MKIARIAPLAYTPGGLEVFSFIRNGSGAEYHQNPHFFVLPTGDLLMNWLAYDYNECSNSAIQLYSVSKDNGIHWSEPQVMMADYFGGVPMVKMLRLRNSRKAIMFQTMTVMDELELDEDRREATGGGNYFKSRTQVVLRRSGDGGRFFDTGEDIPHTLIASGRSLPVVGFYGCIEELVQLESGRIVACFLYIDPDRSDIATGRQHFTGGMLLSDDEGKTWRAARTPITIDKPRGVMELQMAETAPNRLIAFYRTKAGYLYQTTSDNGGETWSDSTPSPLTSPESMPRMIKLHSGKLLMAWNPVSSTTQQPRYPMAVATSADGGKSWTPPRTIATETGENQLSNQAVIQLADGRIILCYSHYYATRPHVSDLDIAIFDEAWLDS